MENSGYQQKGSEEQWTYNYKQKDGSVQLRAARLEVDPDIAFALPDYAACPLSGEECREAYASSGLITRGAAFKLVA